MPFILRFLGYWLNEGERDKKLPRPISYAVLLFSMAFVLLRLLLGTWRIMSGQQKMLTAAHETEDLMVPGQQDQKQNCHGRRFSIFPDPRPDADQRADHHRAGALQRVPCLAAPGR